MLDSKKIWSNYQQPTIRKQKISECYKNKLLNYTEPKKKKKNQKFKLYHQHNDNNNKSSNSNHNPNTKRNYKKEKLDIGINYKKKVSKNKIQKKKIQQKQQTKRTLIQQNIIQNIQNQKSIQSSIVIQKQLQTARQLRFLRASKQLFRGMDFFGRGYITQANINRWIPQSALYFLGTVFQKLRKENKSIDQQQFVNECQALRLKSNKEDIQLFVNDIQNINLNTNQQKEHLNKNQNDYHLKKSLDFDFKFDNPNIQSKVQEKITVSNYRQKSSHLNQNNEFQKIILKEKQSNHPFQQQNKIFQKFVFNKHLFHKEQREKLKDTINQLTFNQDRYQKIFNKDNAQNYQNTQNKKSSHRQHSRKSSLKQKDDRKWRGFEKQQQQKLYQQIPLQIKIQQNDQNLIKNNINIKQNIKGKKQLEQQLQKLKFKQKLCQNQLKINILSNRVQQFIKKNAQRIQRSKNLRLNM